LRCLPSRTPGRVAVWRNTVTRGWTLCEPGCGRRRPAGWPAPHKDGGRVWRGTCRHLQGGASAPCRRAGACAPTRVGARRAASATANGSCDVKRTPTFRLQSSGGRGRPASTRGCGRGGPMAGPGAASGLPPASQPGLLSSRPLKQVASTSRVCRRVRARGQPRGAGAQQLCLACDSASAGRVFG